MKALASFVACKTKGTLSSVERSAVQDFIMAWRAAKPSSYVENVPERYTSECNHDVLNHKGFMAAGCFSAVIEHPENPDLVIKIQMRADDVAYLYYNEILEDKSSCVVRIFKAAQVLGHNCWVMERIRDTVHYSLECFVYEKFSSQRYYELRRTQAKIFAAIKVVARKIKHLIKDRVRFDVHHGNVAFRRDGSVVVLDPIAGRT